MNPLSHQTQPLCPVCGAPQPGAPRLCARCGHPLTQPPQTFEMLVTQNNAPPMRVPIPAATVTIGRAHDSTILISDPKVSRRHLQLTWNGAAFVAEDVGSSGGTLLNGMPLRSPTILRPGDTLSIGDTILRLEIASGTATVLAPPREQAPSVPQTPTTPAHLQPPSPAYAPPAAPPPYQPPASAQPAAPPPYQPPAYGQPVTPPPYQPPSSAYAPPAAPPYQPPYRQEPVGFPPPPASPAAPPYPGMAQIPVSPPPRRSSHIGIILGIVAVFLLIGGGAAAVILGPWRSTVGNVVPPPPDQEQPAPLTMTLTPQEQTIVAPDGQPHTDSHGASMIVPADILEEAAHVELIASSAQGTLADALSRDFTIETPFYAIVADNDGRGRASLTLPAATPDSRVAVVIDTTYLAILDTQPVNGVLHVEAAVTPKTLPDTPVPGTTRDGSIHYVVLRAKSGSAASPAGTGSALGLNLAPRRAYAAEASQTNTYMSCLALFTRSSQRCRTDGRVYVMWLGEALLETTHVDAIIAQTSGIMKAYADKGFTAAGSNASLWIVVDRSVSAPQYSIRSEVIYLPLDSATSISGDKARRELAHELFHWIQDEAYAMTAAALSGAKTWWLETTAENGVFLIDNRALEYNLHHYGQTTVNGAMLGFQAAPFTWGRNDEARYVHAQLLKVNMCEYSTDCPISEKDMIWAINRGRYPLNDAAAQAKILAHLDDYARYLLGVAPEHTNTSIPLHETVRVGDAFGDIIQISRTPKSEFSLSTSSSAPQIVQETPDGRPPEYHINAAIEQGGVYPLQVISGQSVQRGHPGWPVMLMIEPGIELLYRQGDEPVKHHDGQDQLILGPIHRTMGYPIVRVVALGRNESNTFKATVRIVDLQGDWVLIPGKTIRNAVVCTPDGGSPTSNTSGTPDAFLAATGVYEWDGPNKLIFKMDPSALPPEYTTVPFELEGSVVIGPDNIQGRQRLAINSPAVSDAHPATAALAFPLIGALVWSSRRRIVLALVLMLLGALLAGCIGIGIIGSAETNYKLTKIEYIGKGDVKGEPIWRISGGTSTTGIDLTIIAQVADPLSDKPPEEQVMQCKGQIETEMVIEIYKDGVFTPSDISGASGQEYRHGRLLLEQQPRKSAVIYQRT
jgi:hypothetical protein